MWIQRIFTEGSEPTRRVGSDPDALGSDPFSQKRALTPDAFAYVSGDITPRW